MKFSVLAAGIRSILALICLTSATAAHCHCKALPEMDRLVAADDEIRSKGVRITETALYDFSLFSYRNIANDAINSRGSYLTTVAQSLAPDCAVGTDVASWVQALLARSDSALVFSRRLAVAKMMADAATPSSSR